MNISIKPSADINLIKIKLLAVILFMVIGCKALSQQKEAFTIHSHNDYTRPQAFYMAFNAGAEAIEADIYLRRGRLMVAHDTADIKATRTLTGMYLEPLLKEMRTRPRPLNLLIDFKESYATLLPQLIRELEPLLPLLKNEKNKAPLTIVITGNRPPPAEYKNYPSYIMFDDDLQRAHTAEEWKRVAQVSLNFENYSGWKGEGALPQHDEKLLHAVINAVHRSGKKIRFWAAPDNSSGWQTLMALNADILNTDKIVELRALLNSRR
jgi:alkaline phosphatase